MITLGIAILFPFQHISTTQQNSTTNLFPFLLYGGQVVGNNSTKSVRSSVSIGVINNVIVEVDCPANKKNKEIVKPEVGNVRYLLRIYYFSRVKKSPKKRSSHIAQGWQSWTSQLP